MSSEEAGSTLGKLRIAFAESNSRLAKARKEAMEWLVSDAPFLLQAEQLDLDAIDHRKAVETLRNATIQEQVLSVLEATLDEVKPKLEKAIKQRIQQTAKAGLSQTQGNLPSAFRFLTADSLEAFTLKHAVHVGEKKPAIEGFFERAMTPSTPIEATPPTSTRPRNRPVWEKSPTNLRWCRLKSVAWNPTSHNCEPPWPRWSTNKTTMTVESMPFGPAPPAIQNSNASSISSMPSNPSCRIMLNVDETRWHNP